MRNLHSIICSLICGAFVFVGGVKLCNSLRIQWPCRGEAFVSSDRDIEGLSGIDHGSERIRHTLKALPSDKRLVLLLPAGDAGSAYFASMVAYLAWPREVDAIEINPDAVNARVRALDPKTLAAILFCRVPPPSFVPRGVQWGSELVFVQSPATGEARL